MLSCWFPEGPICWCEHVSNCQIGKNSFFTWNSNFTLSWWKKVEGQAAHHVEKKPKRYTLKCKNTSNGIKVTGEPVGIPKNRRFYIGYSDIRKQLVCWSTAIMGCIKFEKLLSSLLWVIVAVTSPSLVATASFPPRNKYSFILSYHYSNSKM